MDIEKASQLARESGFEFIAPLAVENLELLPEVREMCSPNMCPQYGKSWSCPPAAADLETLSRRIAQFSKGVLVQTVGQMDDAFDFETIQETAELHARKFTHYTERMREETDGTALPLGAGTCRLCASCTYPDEPCRYPDKMITSMEASGLLVNQVCTENGLLYNHGEKTITYTSCCLFNE